MKGRLPISTKKEGKWVKPYMVNSKGKYLNSVGNIEVNLLLYILCEFWILNGYPSQATF